MKLKRSKGFRIDLFVKIKNVVNVSKFYNGANMI